MGFFIGPTNVADQTAALGIYASVNKFVTTNQDVTNSSTLTDSTDLQVSLAANATYDFHTLELIGSSSPTSAGAKTKIVYTGTATWYGIRRRDSSTNAEPINVSPTWGGSAEVVDGQINDQKSVIGERYGRIVTTTAGTLKIQFAQNTAVSGHYARLLVGSFIRIQRVA